MIHMQAQGTGERAKEAAMVVASLARFCTVHSELDRTNIDLSILLPTKPGRLASLS